MDGSRRPHLRAQVDRFVGFLRKRIALPVTLVDEKLSSFAAEEMGKEIASRFPQTQVVPGQRGRPGDPAELFRAAMKRAKKRSWQRVFPAAAAAGRWPALAWFGYGVYRKVFSPYQGYANNAVVQIDSGMTRGRHRQKAAAPGRHRQRRIFQALLPPVLRRQETEGGRIPFRRARSPCARSSKNWSRARRSSTR